MARPRGKPEPPTRKDVARMRGAMDCYQDRCENVPFACIGGLAARSHPRTPKWILPEDRADYVAGYTQQAEDMFGEDWRTCTFSWRHVLTIRRQEDPDPSAVGNL